MRTLSRRRREAPVVEIEYLKEGDEAPTHALVEPYTIERELPVWRVHTWDRTVDGPRTYRLDRMRSARLTDAIASSHGTASTRTTSPSRAVAPALALAADRTLEARARRAGADGQVGRLRRAVQDGGVAPLRGARRPRRDGRARARVDAACSRRTRARRSRRSSGSARDGSGRQRKPESRARAGILPELERPAVRLGDRPRNPEAEPARPGPAHATCEDVDRRVDPRPVVRHVDDDRSVVLADARS